ncbi:hypothetical protein, partial [Atlantibacter sp.]|uniref:hypothetical protein n=1 Tax=Atlantibacter sp. TaxID=1903473 RepID=UPI0028B1732E
PANASAISMGRKPPRYVQVFNATTELLTVFKDSQRQNISVKNKRLKVGGVVPASKSPRRN